MISSNSSEWEEDLKTTAVFAVLDKQKKKKKEYIWSPSSWIHDCIKFDVHEFFSLKPHIFFNYL